MILTPEKLSTSQLKAAIDEAEKRFGDHVPDELKPVLEAARAELKRKEALN